MESWLMDMEYPALYENVEEFLNQLKSASAKTKKVWKHIVTHVRPKKEVEIIKKQCLLHRLSTATPPYFNIEVRLNSVKDFEYYLQKKKDLTNLKKKREQVEEKKKNIMEQLHKLELARKNLVIEEELMKESVYKLSHLKNKKTTVERNIKKFENDTKLLKILMTSPNRFVHYGTEVSDLERKVLMYVSELPPATELETIVTKMGELHKSSQLPAPLWDRTRTLTEMEKVLSSKLKVLKERKLESEAIDKELYALKNNITVLMAQGNISNVDELLSLLNHFEDIFMKEAIAIADLLIETKPPYMLESEHHTIRRFNHLIEAKAKDVSKFLPLEKGDCDSLDLPAPLPDISFPVRPQIKKLHNSVSTEINYFMDLVVRPNLTDHIINYIQPCTSSYDQLVQLNNCMKMHSKIMVIEEKIHNLTLPTIGEGLNSKMDELHSKLSEKMKCVKSETEILENIYERVKAAINFLRKQPLNENLVGLMIEDKDISYWLRRFASAKRKHDHELWLLNNRLE